MLNISQKLKINRYQNESHMSIYQAISVMLTMEITGVGSALVNGLKSMRIIMNKLF